MPHGPTHRRQVAALLAAALVVAGCGATGGGATGKGGETGKPAAQILSDAQAAAQSADSVHISGTVARGSGTAGAPAATAKIDLLLTASGDGREQITGSGQDIDLVRVGPTLYVKGVGAAGYQQLSVQDPRAAPLVAQLDKKTVFAQLIKSGDAAAVTGSATLAGQPAVKITPSSGVGVLFVADDATNPYPLEVETSPSATASTTATAPVGALTFSDWNAHTVISPPTGSGS